MSQAPRTLPRVELVPLEEHDREQFITDNQWAFLYGATQEFGMRDDHMEQDGQIIARETIERALDDASSTAYRIALDGEKVGGIVLALDEDERRGILELLFVSPACHSAGIGQAAWHEVERLHPEIRVWELVTPYFEKRNIHFYVNKLGFHIVEFFNEHHPDPNESDAFEEDKSGGEMFRFEKVMGA